MGKHAIGTPWAVGSGQPTGQLGFMDVLGFLLIIGAGYPVEIEGQN